MVRVLVVLGLAFGGGPSALAQSWRGQIGGGTLHPCAPFGCRYPPPGGWIKKDAGAQARKDAVVARASSMIDHLASGKAPQPRYRPGTPIRRHMGDKLAFRIRMGKVMNTLRAAREKAQAAGTQRHHARTGATGRKTYIDILHIAPVEATERTLNDVKSRNQDMFSNWSPPAPPPAAPPPPEPTPPPTEAPVPAGHVRGEAAADRLDPARLKLVKLAARIAAVSAGVVGVPLHKQKADVMSYRFFQPKVQDHLSRCLKDQSSYRARFSVLETEVLAQVREWDAAVAKLLAKEEAIENGASGAYDGEPPPPVDDDGLGPDDEGPRADDLAIPTSTMTLLTVIGGSAMGAGPGVSRDLAVRGVVDAVAANPGPTAKSLGFLLGTAGADKATADKIAGVLADYVAQRPQTSQDLVAAMLAAMRGEPGGQAGLAAALGKAAREDPGGTAVLIDLLSEELSAPKTVRQASAAVAAAAKDDPESAGKLMDAMGKVYAGDPDAGEALGEALLQVHQGSPQLARGLLLSVVRPATQDEALPVETLGKFLDALAADPQDTVRVGKILARAARGDDGSLEDLGGELRARVPGFTPSITWQLKEARDRLLRDGAALAALEAKVDALLQVPDAERGWGDGPSSWSGRRAARLAEVKALQGSLAAVRKLVDAAP